MYVKYSQFAVYLLFKSNCFRNYKYVKPTQIMLSSGQRLIPYFVAEHYYDSESGELVQLFQLVQLEKGGSVWMVKSGKFRLESIAAV